MKYLFCIFVLFVIPSCGSQVKESVPIIQELTQSPIDSYHLDVITEKDVPFSGYVNFDEFNKMSGGNMMYSGYSAATFLVSILAHAAASKSAHAIRMKSFMDKQDEKALKSCKDYIADFRADYIKSNFIEARNDTNQKGQSNFVSEVSEEEIPLGFVLSTPDFILTEDGSTLLVENKITLSSSRLDRHPEVDVSKKRSKKRSKIKTPSIDAQTINIVILSESSSDLMGSEGEKLKSLALELYAQSMDVAFKHSPLKSEESKKAKPKYETIKFYIGDHFRVERGLVLNRQCDRVVFRSLRGWIKSVPQENTCASESVSVL